MNNNIRTVYHSNKYGLSFIYIVMDNLWCIRDDKLDLLLFVHVEAARVEERLKKLLEERRSQRLQRKVKTNEL